MSRTLLIDTLNLSVQWYRHVKNVVLKGGTHVGLLSHRFRLKIFEYDWKATDWVSPHP